MPDTDDLEEKLLSEVGDLMSREIRTVEADATLREASGLMGKYNVGSLLVLGGGQYLGILTDTDLARKGLAQGVNPEKDRVQSLMSSPIITIDSHRLVEEARALMKGKGWLPNQNSLPSHLDHTTVNVHMIDTRRPIEDRARAT